ncbi:MAG TPA: hypothetical protein VK158_03725 [Acidobacteriota bacterium]|nr:hypothetical protein [Acidobacteriota bacterium]
MTKYIIYFDKKTESIIDFFPNNLSEVTKQSITEIWMQPICREILKLLTVMDSITAPVIQKHIGHSMSTLHENIKRLEQAKLIEAEMSYKGNKQKIIKTNTLVVSKNSKLTESITRFLNTGLWVDSERSNKIVEFLQANPDKFYSVEEISAKTSIQVDEVQTLLDNWDSQITRSFSDFLKKAPFEKKVLYRGSKK